MLIILFSYFMACVLIIEKHLLPNWIYGLSSTKTLLFSLTLIGIATLTTSQLSIRNIIIPAVTIFGSLLIINKYNHVNLFHLRK